MVERINLAIYAAGAAAREIAGRIVYLHPSHRAGGKIWIVWEKMRINNAASTKCGIETPPIAMIMLTLSTDMDLSFDAADNIPLPVPMIIDRMNAITPRCIDTGRVSIIISLTDLPRYL